MDISFGHNQLFVAGFFVNLASGGLSKTLQSTASDDASCFVTAKVGGNKNVNSVRHGLGNQSGGEVNHSSLRVRKVGDDSIEYCLDNGIMNGTGEDTFSPDDNITRAQFATMFYNFAYTLNHANEQQAD